MQNRLFVFEGLDGCGKTTLMQSVADELTKRGHGVVVTKAPGGCKETEIYRELLCSKERRLTVAEEESYLYRDYECHKRCFIDPAMSEGKIVLCDRYILYSSMVYQCDSINGMQDYYKNNILKGINRPARVFILNTPPEVCMERIRATRGEDATAYDLADAETYKERYSRYKIMATIPEVVTVGWRKSPQESAEDVADQIEQVLGIVRESVPVVEPKYKHTEVKMNREDVPVYVISQVFTESGQAVELTTPIFDVNGTPVKNIFEGSLNYEAMDLFNMEGYPLIAASKYMIYFPKGPLYTAYNTEVYSRRDEALLLQDEKGRPVYPISTVQGYLYDQNTGQNIYPVLKGDGKLYTRDLYTVKPPQMQLFTEDGTKVYPYSVSDPGAFAGAVPLQSVHNRPEGNPFIQERQGMNTGENQDGMPNQEELDKDIQEEFIPGDAVEDEEAAKQKASKKVKYICSGLAALLVLIVVIGFISFGGFGTKFEIIQDTVTAEISTDMEVNISEFLGKRYPKDVKVSFGDVNGEKLVYNKETGKILSSDGRAIALGDYSIEFKHEKETLKGLLRVVDTVSPQIDGPSEITLGLNEWDDDTFMARYTITDESKYKTSIDTYGKDLNARGTYRVDIIAKDTAKNSTTKTVTVTVTKSQEQLQEEADKKAAEEEAKKAKEEAEAKAKEEAEKKEQEDWFNKIQDLISGNNENQNNAGSQNNTDNQTQNTPSQPIDEGITDESFDIIGSLKDLTQLFG